jgi:hypothetical protein
VNTTILPLGVRGQMVWFWIPPLRGMGMTDRPYSMRLRALIWAVLIALSWAPWVLLWRLL